MPPLVPIEQVGAILDASELISSWRILVADQTTNRAVCKIRCQLLRPAYQLEIRFIKTETDLIYAYQVFTNSPLLRWDNAPHFPAIKSFPHHMHEESREVKASALVGDPVIDLPLVLAEITTLLAKSQ